MLTIKYLTPEEQNELDPCQSARQFLAKFKSTDPTPVPIQWRHISREQWYSEWYALRAKSYARRYSSEFEYDVEHDSKYGPQGNSFPLSELQDKFRKSYLLADRKLQFAPMLYIARNWLLRRIESKIAQQGLPQIYRVRGTDGTLSGLPYMLKKGSFHAETHRGLNWNHVVEDVPGERSQRLKHRGINVDSVDNVREIEQQLTAVRNWLKTVFPEYFSAWINPKCELQPRIHDALIRHNLDSVVIDYEDCDDSFSLTLVIDLILPIYELLLPPGEYWHFAAFIEELFSQPIFFGDELWTGLHNLLSGQAITNDFETIYTVICAIAVHLTLHSTPKLILALGDDGGLLVPQGMGVKALELYRDYSASAGMLLSVQKSRVLPAGEMTFCRKYYSRKQRPWLNERGQWCLMGIYPTILTLNNIINPERYATVHKTLVADIQRADNLLGSPVHKPFLDFLFSRWNPAVPRPTFDDIKDVVIEDWWSRVYGEPFSIVGSPSWAHVSKEVWHIS